MKLKENDRHSFTSSITGLLLENQRQMNQQRRDNEPAQFQRIQIPLVRRIYPQLIANDLVSVQPLSGPTSLTYYMNYRYSTNRGTFYVELGRMMRANMESWAELRDTTGDPRNTLR